MNYIVFLGTGGGGNVVFRQARASGGIYIELDAKRFVIDPGPGSLVHMRRLKLKDPHGILVSHSHPDHFTDANIMLDGIKDPFLLAEKHCVEITGSGWPPISKYHKSKAKVLKAMSPGEFTGIPGSGIKITATKAEHPVPALGFVIEGSSKIGYVSDTTYFKGIEKPFEGCEILIFNVLVPAGKVPEKNKHMGVDDAVKFLKNMKQKPEMVIITHFSFWMLQNNVYKQARIIQEKTGINTIPAKDFMKIDIDRMKTVKEGLEKFSS